MQHGIFTFGINEASLRTISTKMLVDITDPVHSYASAAVHSAFDVGLLRAKIRSGGGGDDGLETCSAAACTAAISRHTASVKIPA